jgi:uncharacterized membrane protein
MDRIRRNLLAGMLAIIPIFITVWIVIFVLDLLILLGQPFVAVIAESLYATAPKIAEIVLAPWFQSLLALIIVVLLLYWLGALTKAVIGRRVLSAFDRLMARIPFVQAVYGATRKLIVSFQQAPDGQQRVVLIEFPSPEMKTLGLVTRTFTATDTGQDLAAVYVPTTPNPTSGYLEIVPVERLVWLDWTTNQAMQFIISGGTVAPDTISFKASSPI